MPRGDKSSYTDKQKRKAQHIEEGYLERGLPRDEAERRAWATVNKESGGGNKSGSGRGVPDNKSASRRGGRIGGRAAARRPDRRTRGGATAGSGTLPIGEKGRSHAQAACGVTLTDQANRNEVNAARRASHGMVGEIVIE